MKRLQVFAVEDTAAQLSWGESSAGVVDVVVEPDGTQFAFALDGGPGTLGLSGLTPGSEYRLRLGTSKRSLSFRTLDAPPGDELFRFATINDLHIGAHRFGLSHRLVERPEPAVLHPVRCARAAVREALAWGAQMLLVKGDLTQRSEPEEWETVGQLLAGLPVPVAVIPGNHEMRDDRGEEPQPALARHGLHLVHGVEVVELPGLRLLMVDSTRPGHERGRLDHVRPHVVALLGRARGAAMIAMHHHPERYPVSTFLPKGIRRAESERFLRSVASANPATLVSTGHTHRHRRHDRHGLTVTEIGSTKDYPGAWAGYVVHEGGIRQVVRRISEPSSIRWTEYTRRAVLGVWGRWSPGTREDRCFSLAWGES